MIDPEAARWLGRVASYEDGIHYPGGPDEQPALLMQAVGVVRGETSVMEARQALQRSTERRQAQARAGRRGGR